MFAEVTAVGLAGLKPPAAVMNWLRSDFAGLREVIAVVIDPAIGRRAGRPNSGSARPPCRC